MKKSMTTAILGMILIATVSADVTCWEQARRYWIRAPAKDKQFEEYVVFHVMDHAVYFFECQTEDCTKLREQNDNDVMNYINGYFTDSFMHRQYYMMETHFEEELSTLTSATGSETTAIGRKAKLPGVHVFRQIIVR